MPAEGSWTPFTDEHRSFRASVATVVDSVISPMLRDGYGDALPIRDVLAALGAAGSMAPGFEPRFAGTPGDLWHGVVLHEELARLPSASIGSAVLSHLEVATRLLADHAAHDVADEWVPRALAGTVVLGYAATEVEAGSDVASTVTSARRLQDGWVIDGRKSYVTNGAEADALCVLARTSDRKVTSHTLFVVPTRVPGVAVRPLRSIGNQGTLGEQHFTNVCVSGEAVIGGEGQGLLLQLRRFGHERAFIAIRLAALAANVLKDLVAHCQERTTFGKPLTANQAIQFRLAELLVQVEQARCLAYHAIDTLSSGDDARAVAATAKLHAARSFRQVADQALQLHGGEGYGQESRSSGAYLDAIGYAFAGGTDHMLLETIAR